MASFPTAIKTFATLVDLVDSVLAAHQNERGSEITAIETELGLNPKGFAVSVLSRLDVLGKLPDGTMFNGKLAPTVASNNLTLTLQTKAGATPSASDPVVIYTGGTLRVITAALAVTRNAGSNWCNAGSAELATKEIDYFAYIGYNATDGVTLGFSRIPFARLYSDFSATATNEKYAGISTIVNAAAGDNYYLIGRFAATLSAGAGYTWSVPTYTALNLYHRPIYETRKLAWAPVITYSGGTTNPTSNTTNSASYQVVMNRVFVSMLHALVRGSGNRTETVFSQPFANTSLTVLSAMDSVNGAALKYAVLAYWSADNLLHHFQTMTSDGSYWDSAWAFVA